MKTYTYSPLVKMPLTNQTMNPTMNIRI